MDVLDNKVSSLDHYDDNNEADDYYNNNRINEYLLGAINDDMIKLMGFSIKDDNHNHNHNHNNNNDNDNDNDDDDNDNDDKNDNDNNDINNNDNNNDDDSNNNIDLENDENENYCIICNDEEVIDSDHSLHHLYPSCHHSNHFGVQCLKKYISGKIQDSAISNLCCPLPGCKERFNQSIIQELVTEKEYRKYQEDTKALTPSCSIFKRVGIFAQDIFSNIQQLFRRVSLDSKRCPNCRYIIEKDGGCNHMTCRKCSHEFHWCCGQKYSRNHSDSTCKFVTIGLPILTIALPLLLLCKFFWGIIVSCLFIPLLWAHTITAGSFFGAFLLNNEDEQNNFRYSLFIGFALILTMAFSWMNVMLCIEFFSAKHSIRLLLLLAFSTFLEYKDAHSFFSLMSYTVPTGGNILFVAVLALASFTTGSTLFFSLFILCTIERCCDTRVESCRLVVFFLELTNLCSSIFVSLPIISCLLLFLIGSFLFIKVYSNSSYESLG